MAAPSSKFAVVSAIVGNSLVMLAKFGAYLFTGSGAMLSEAIHTLADLLNQILLLFGIVRSGRDADQDYEYGYLAERYVWALVSAVGIFFLGCGVTTYHGIMGFVHPHEVHVSPWAIAVLIVSLIIEGYVLYVAVKSVAATSDGKPFFKYLKNDADPAVVAVVLEDSAACIGIILALIALVLTQITGNSHWDALGSISIGILLGFVAIFLVMRNRQLLVGSSIPDHVRRQVQQIINQNPAVEEIVDLRTRILDTETYRIKADIKFDGRSLAKKLDDDIDAAYPNINNIEDFREFASGFADDVIELLAEEIDAIERRIRHTIPQAQHLDLEAD